MFERFLPWAIPRCHTSRDPSAWGEWAESPFKSGLSTLTTNTSQSVRYRLTNPHAMTSLGGYTPSCHGITMRSPDAVGIDVAAVRGTAGGAASDSAGLWWRTE